MGEVFVEHLSVSKQFFERFANTVDLSDQLPVKVAGYNLTECEIPGAVGDWALQYLEQRKCPPFLIAHLVRTVVEEVKTLIKTDPFNCGYRSDIGGFLSLRLMQACVGKLIEVCSRYKDKVELSSLPLTPSNHLPLVTSCAVKNCRRSMEDRHVVIHDFHGLFNIKGQGPASYYGVFDGHNGTDAAIYSVSHLHQYLAESPFYPDNPVRALRDACIKTDDSFSIKAQRENLHGGTTAVLALLKQREHKLYVAWIGDSQAVLVRQGVPLQIVRPHKPDRTDERDRIEAMGGTVLYWGAWRVNGQLAVSRAIGDIEYKPYVTAEPDVEEITLDGTEDFLILACDGLWDFVSEQQATNAVYKQLQENPEDLEAVSHRLVALAKEQSSQDNISVLVVFLASPIEVARRRVMETASPNPFVAVGQNGADAMFHGGVTNGVDDDDFGPETDVDMVDDVLLSPAIAAAKALVAGCHEVDDLERQRQQLADFDDPADMDPNRDTPTPPAHEVVSNANVDPLAESGGEESEEEWNYIPGKDTKADTDFQEQEDMSSQLNPNAAEFVPVSPTRLLMMDDAIISASPGLGFEKSLDDVQVPSEIEFNDEISHRPGDLGITNGPKSKHTDDYFMRDNFSTLRNKSPEFNSSTCAQLGDDSIVSLQPSLNNSTAFTTNDVPFDKLEALQNIAESKGSLFGSDGDFCNNAFGVSNVFSKNDPMTTSMIGHGDFTSSSEPEDNVIPGTPKSTIVEASVSPINEDVSPFDHQTDLESSPAKDPQKSLDFMSSEDGPEDPLGLGQEKTSSSGFESESGIEDGENIQDTNEGFITEHRRSPPVDLSFKPIQTFSDLNPFGALQTPSTTTPLDSVEKSMQVNDEESKLPSETPKKIEDNRQEDQFSFMVNTPSSFISARQKTPLDDKPVPFDELESPTDIPQFEVPPIANSSVLASELPKSPEPHLNNFEETLSSKTEPLESECENHISKDHHSQDFFTEEPTPQYQETSFTTEIDSLKESAISHEDLDTTAGFLIEESKILNDEEDFEKSKNNFENDHEPSKLVDENQIVSSEIPQQLNIGLDHDDNSLKDREQESIDNVNASVEELKHHSEIKDFDFESETKEMNLEFESHIASQNTISENIVNFDDGFEVINKDELTLEESSPINEITDKEIISEVPDQAHHVNESPVLQQNENLLLPVKSVDPFSEEEHMPSTEISIAPVNNQENCTEQETSVSFTNTHDKIVPPDEEHHETEKVPSFMSTPEPEVLKTESYQLLTPAVEPICTKTESFLTETDDIKHEHITEDIHAVEVEKALEVEPISTDLLSNKTEEKTDLETVPIETTNELSLPKEETVLAKSEPAQVVTETLITALEETSEVPLSVTTEVPSTAGTPPPTPVPEPEKDDSEKEMLVAAVAAAGAVVAGATLAVDKIKKDTTASKKPSPSGTKKVGDATAKAPIKATSAKAPAAKPASAKTTTTKPASTATKPVSATTKPAGLTAKPSTTTVPKPAATKTSVPPTTTKKPVASAKPAPAKPTSASQSKPTSTTSAPKTVPKHLPVNKTSTTLKSTSKPTTPTSKPTTPTAPKSPSVLKNDVVKSPPRPAVRSTLATSKPSPAAKSPLEDSDKKTITNGEVKPGVKKLADGPAKKPATTTTSKPLAASRPSAPLSKTAPATKAPTAASAKAQPSKPTSTVPPKPKPTTTAAATKSTVPPPIKRPSSGTAVKLADKTGKETANKQISNAKPAVNGKVPTKTANGAKKTDAKVNGKTDKLVPSKKLDEIKAENEMPTKVQEDNITTTNGFGEHIDHIIEENGSMKNDVLSPVILENVN